MARMRPLNPAPQMTIGPGPFRLIATEAGRYAQGLQLTCQLWNGTCLDSRLVLVNNIAPYVTTQHQQFSLDKAALERALLDLVVAVEGVLRPQRGHGTKQTPRARPAIELTPEIHEVADQTEAALLQLPDAPLYQRAHRLVCIAAGMPPPPGVTRPENSAVIWPVTAPLLAELAAKAARFFTYDGDDMVRCRPPSWLMQTLLARTERPFPPLEGLVYAPTIRPDGSVLATEGYDRATGLSLALGGVPYPAIPAHPSREDGVRALAQLKDPLQDFPFAERWHESAAIAMILTVVCRPFIEGTTPLGGIGAHNQGAGKGLLANVIAIIGTGRPCAFWPQPTNEEEERKRLLAIGLQGDVIVCIDNVTRPFGSGTFANVITGLSYKDRILGYSENVEVPIRCVWLATGNNLTYVGDMARRVVPIIIDPHMERPEERTGFAYADLLAHVQQQRPTLVAAALTLMRAYIAAGLPPQTSQAYGSFEEWYRKVCGALLWLGEPDPCEGRKALQAEVEDELLHFRQLVRCWHACYHATLSTPRTLKQVAFETQNNATNTPNSPNAWNDLKDALGAFDPKYDGQHLDTHGAGYALRKYQGRVVDGKRFVKGPETRQGYTWFLAVV